MKFKPEQHYDVMTTEGFRVFTSIRNHDKQVLVQATHEDDMIKIMPVDSEEELRQWFWKYVEELGGMEDGAE